MKTRHFSPKENIIIRQLIFNRYCRYDLINAVRNNDFFSLLTEEYHEVLCHDPGFLQDSLSIICVGDPLAQPVVIASSYSGNIESCPQRHSWEPLSLGPCYSNALNSLCYNDDVCTIDSQDVFMDNSTICLQGDVFVLKLQYRCQSTCITYFFKIKKNPLFIFSQLTYSLVRLFVKWRNDIWRIWTNSLKLGDASDDYRNSMSPYKVKRVSLFRPILINRQHLF